jgi:hypothetical protein
VRSFDDDHPSGHETAPIHQYKDHSSTPQLLSLNPPPIMLRQQIIKVARINARPLQRSFTAAAVRAAEGDTGAIRSGGIAQG